MRFLNMIKGPENASRPPNALMAAIAIGRAGKAKQRFGRSSIHLRALEPLSPSPLLRSLLLRVLKTARRPGRRRPRS